MGAVQAGGTWFEPSEVRVESGDVLELTATVDRASLGLVSFGWVEDGPFFAYLQGDEFGAARAEGHGGTATDVRLGELELDGGNGKFDVTVTITLPGETPAGEYLVTVCNDPCTTGLGDLLGAVLYVGIDAPPAALAPARMTLAPYPERSSDLSPTWVAIPAALGGAVLLLALFSRQRG